jgi:formyl-CoA transferase
MLDQERHWEPTCRALGLDELLDHPGYATVEIRQANTPALHELFVTRIASLSLDDLKQRLAAADTIWSTMASPNEVLADPQVAANGYLPRVPGHPTARLSSAPMQFDGSGLEIRRRAPGVGEHTNEVFREVGVDPAEIDRLRAAGALA